MNNKQYCMHHDEESWWEYDARGIPLCKVCELCRDAKLSAYRGDVLTNPSYYSDAPIEES
jgi:hypothetical protein